MDRLDSRFNHSGSVQSEESALDLERNYFNHLPLSSPPPLQAFASGCQVAGEQCCLLPHGLAADAAEDRAIILTYQLFLSLLPEKFTGKWPPALSNVYRLFLRFNLVGTPVLAFNINSFNVMIILLRCAWCDVDVVEFSYFGAPAATPKEQLYTELVDGLRGSDPRIGSGSQVIDSSDQNVLSLLSDLLV
ncbi:hypothetical protein HAX54_032917 [Datura stramonium]|uniref:Nal1 C-terminal domain-containing protein n=1 Tax=Datura stramonium TaxID=4076 RepID=A0ABS8SCZ0_DATST|nr:hypothetical protein [Datura stramonium]